ncbi:MAG: B12-binding domain-containing radical SAM protein [Anaerolineales bacterium]|nr:B12-binding domain-containing radical SAM protein [Anaerolineales bacterium]
MKIRLVEPKPAGINVFDRALLPRLGLPLIGRVLADAGHDVRIYVEQLEAINWTDVLSSNLVGFSATTTTIPVAFAQAAILRQANIPTVFGGSHVTFLPDEALDHCDYVVRGEGQETILELVDVIEGKINVQEVRGLSYRSGNIKVHNPDRPACSQDVFSALPAPDLSLIVGHERMTNIPIMTQWGCPFNCDFCSVVAMFGRQVRWRPMEAVYKELERYKHRGSVFFYDDNFVVNEIRTKKFLRGMIDRNLTPNWSAQVRAEVVYRNKHTRELDTELLELMRDSGCKIVYCGFESANPKTLELYNKQQDVEHISDSIRAFHAYGIQVHGMFVLGSDADDAVSIQMTVDFAIENEIDTVQFLMLTPCPGTAFWDRMTATGRVLNRDWTLFDGHHCVIQPALMTPYELQLASYKAMSSFYSSRRSVGQLLANITRNIPFLLTLALRERRLRLQLPRLALWSLRPARWPDALSTLMQAVSKESRDRLTAMFAVPTLRLYAHRHIQKWRKQAHSLAYVEFLKRLVPRSTLSKPGSL